MNAALVSRSASAGLTLLLSALVTCGCGGGGSDSCAVVSASGDNSQAACSTGGGIDQDIDQSGDEDELEDLIPECVETCKERGNPDPEIFGLTDGFEACHNDCAGGAFDEEEDDDDDEDDNIFGLRDRDREGSDDDDDERGGDLFGADVSSLVLAGTIAAILGSVGYSGYKLLKIRQKKPAVPKGSSKPS